MADLHADVGRDPSRNTSNASYSFDYDEIDRRLEPTVSTLNAEDLTLEFLIRGLLIVKEDIRPHLCIDVIIYGLRHPVYQCFSQQQIGDWNRVTKANVCVRVKETQARLGLSEAAINSLAHTRCGPLFNAAHGLVTVLLFVARYQEPKSAIDCVVQATGHPISDGVSLETIARRYGITKAGVHKQLCDIKQHLNLPRSRYNKKPEASIKYAQSNPNNGPVSGFSNGPSLPERQLSVVG